MATLLLTSSTILILTQILVLLLERVCMYACARGSVLFAVSTVRMYAHSYRLSSSYTRSIISLRSSKI